MLRLNRRNFVKNTSLITLSSCLSQSLIMKALANNPLKVYSVNVAKVTNNWNQMSEKANVPIDFYLKKGSSKEFLQLFSKVGGGQKLYDAITDNGGNQEDLLFESESIVTLDTSRIKNWKNLIPQYNEGNFAADTIRNKNGEIVAVPYISNADSLAYNKAKVGADIDSWDALFDSQFKGYVSLQNEPGPTLSTTALYLKETGKQDIIDPSDLSKSELKGVCEFLIDKKKKGQFKTFWKNFSNGIDLLVSEQVLVSSCWEPIAVIASKKGADIHYGTMKEGHQTWNNVWMLTKGGKERGQEDNFYKLMDLYLSPWFGARTLSMLGFTPQMIGVHDYIKRNPNEFDKNKDEILAQRLKNKAKRLAVKGNSWQNLYPQEFVSYQNWWKKIQAA